MGSARSHLPSSVWGAASSQVSPPYPQIQIAPPGLGGGNNSPSPALGRKLPPTAKMAPGPRPLGLTRRAPQSRGGTPAPLPGGPPFPLTWPAACFRESYGRPQRDPLSCAGAVILPERRLPRLSRALLSWRGVVPPRRAVRGFHRGEEGAGLPDPATQSTRSSDNSNDNVIQMKQGQQQQHLHRRLSFN